MDQKILINLLKKREKNSIFFLSILQNNGINSINELCDNLTNYNISLFNLIYDIKNLVLGDPFLFEYKNRTYIFFEKLNINSIGEIAYIEINNNKGKFNYTEPKIVLKGNYHLSYPMIFLDNNNIFMIPEQGQKNKLQIYKSIQFPDIWEEYSTIFDSCNAKDTTIFKHDNMYYIFTHIRKKGIGDTSKIFFSNSLTGKWKGHPYNTNSPVTRPGLGFGRGAGRIFRFNENIYRPIQNNITQYGEGLIIRKIIKLDTEELIEEDYIELNRKIHHIDFNSKWIVVDFNDYNGGKKRDITDDIYNNLFKDFIEMDELVNSRHNRRIMRDEIFPLIGDYMRDQKNKNILSIGFCNRNIFDYSWFNNMDIQLWFIDVNFDNKLTNKINNELILGSIIDYDNTKIKFYQVIISFGVLSYIKFTKEEILQYLQSIYNLLIDDGIFYLKIDNKHMIKKKWDKEIIISDIYIYKFFMDIEDPFYIKEGFTFYSLRKKLK